MYQSIEDIDLINKTVVVRVDYNVPIKDGKIMDDTRIVKSLKTINYLLDNNCKIVLLSHLGKVKSEEDKSKNSLNIVGDYLSKLLEREVLFTDDFNNCVDIINNMDNGNIILLENTRWFDYPEKLESNCDDNLSKFFASLGEIFVNDAFGTIHRNHASNVGVSKYLPSVVGYLVKEELDNLNKIANPERPYIVILGGSKVSDKTKLLENIIEKCDYLLIGGGMCFPFLKVLGYNLGNSLVDNESLDFCRLLLEKYKDKIILPVDLVCNKEFIDSEGITYDIDSIPDDLMAMDIGPKTIVKFSSYLNSAKTIVWNGPLGVYEFVNYQDGTRAVLEIISKLDSYTIVGGGDIVSAVNNLGYNGYIDHISTGGGATLAYLQGDDLVGVSNIRRR